MEISDREPELETDVTTIVEELGFRVVEIHSATVKGRRHLDLVIYRPEGVSIDDCAEVHRVVRPRAELVLDNRDVAVQVASPGIDRTFKSNREFSVFVGRGVKVLLRGSNDWIGGVVDSADDRDVMLRSGDQRQSIAFADIQKARLDYSQEVR